MIIRSGDISYEVMQALPGEAGVSHYLCRERESQEQCHLVSMGKTKGLGEFIPFLAELEANAAFTDLKGYFLEEDILWLVFAWEGGEPLGEYLRNPHSPGERFALGCQVMERLILLMMPACIQWEALEPGRMYVKEDGTPCFFYSLGNWKAYAGLDASMALGRLGDLLELFFQKEEETGLYPEWEEFLDRLEAGEWTELLDIYKAYLELLPVFSQERKKEKKPGFKEKFKKLQPRLLAVVKIALGLTVLAAAAVSAVELWKGKVAPVVDAAVVWKAAYVDGETPETEPEAEETTGDATEEETDPDNGRGERYRKDGSLCYRGGLKDGLYDDRGTLYYPNGEIAYQGGFAFGKKEGEGCLYTDTGILFYEGEFKKDLFEGQGRLYDGDTGSLVYEGGFSGGRYGGEGALYDGETGFPRYVGNFRLGKYDGMGLEFDLNGSMFYEGEFLLGRRHGKGTLYDPLTGAVLFEGVFRNDNYIGPLEDKDRQGENPEDAGGDEKTEMGEEGGPEENAVIADEGGTEGNIQEGGSPEAEKDGAESVRAAGESLEEGVTESKEGTETGGSDRDQQADSSSPQASPGPGAAQTEAQGESRPMEIGPGVTL